MPTCSIIISAYNWASLTRQCLNLLLADPPAIDTEIIVVDDGSRDTTAQLLSGYGDQIRVVTRAMHGGVASARNDGAAIAAGEYLVFLNNDTQPAKGWLDALVQRAAEQPRAAVVGSKVLSSDSTVQHAGVVVCQDRFTRAIYAGFPSDHPAVNRTRRFQAVSGACMLVRRSAFQKVNGFDTAFVDAYADHDLCLRLGELGYEVYYCHDSVVYHLGSLTSVNQPSARAHANALFRQRWAHRIEPDDLAYFTRDGLVRLHYGESYPIRMDISPLVGVFSNDARCQQADHLLTARARQVHELVHENMRLRARLIEVEHQADEAGRQPPGVGVTSGHELADTAGASSVGDAQQALLPPPELVRMVGGDFEATGVEFSHLLPAIGGLRPTDSILEVGCGVGRIAVALTRVMAETGQYAGFDVMKAAIDWCQEQVTPRFPRFRFEHADIYNTFYNPTGPLNASEYRFPYDDRSFDFVYLTSVFTHMLPPDVEQYVSEIVRVLKPGGRCLVTFFLLNEESQGLIAAGLADPFNFKACSTIYAALFPELVESAIAYDESYVRSLFASHGLKLIEPIHYGSWCGRLDGLSLQDILVAVKQPEEQVS